VLGQVHLGQLWEGCENEVRVVGVGHEGLMLGQLGAGVLRQLVLRVPHPHRVSPHGQVARQGFRRRLLVTVRLVAVLNLLLGLKRDN
jgi:hypothetical protein